MPHLFLRGVLAVLVFSILFASNTVMGNEFRDGLLAKAGIVMSMSLCLGIVAHAIVCSKLTLRELGIGLLFSGGFGLLYAAIWIHSGDEGSLVQLTSLSLLFLVGMAWMALKREGHCELMLESIVNVIFVLAALSLVLWILGPLWEIFPVTRQLKYSWAPGDGTGTPILSYCDLLYYTQNEHMFSRMVARNSGIFVESPIYCFVLTVAVLVESFMVRRAARKNVLIVLLATIISTFSVTGYVILFIMGAYPVFGWVRDLVKRIRHRPKQLAVFVAVVAVLAGAAIYIVCKKLTSASWAIRMDDYVAGFKAWCNSSLLGNGLRSDQALLNQMGEFRINNTGMSNTIMQVLAFGGLALLLPFVVGFLGFFMQKSPKTKYCIVVYTVAWAVTVVTFLPISLAIFGVGIGEAMMWVNDSSLCGGASSVVRLKGLGFRRAMLGMLAISSGTGLFWIAGYTAGTLFIQPSYIATTDVEARSALNYKVVDNEDVLSHVDYVLGSQYVHKVAAKSLKLENSDKFIMNTEVQDRTVQLSCSSNDADASILFLRRAVRASSKAQWVVWNKLTLRYYDISTERHDPPILILSCFVACAGAIIGIGLSLVQASRYLHRKEGTYGGD